MFTLFMNICSVLYFHQVIWSN